MDNHVPGGRGWLPFLLSGHRVFSAAVPAPAWAFGTGENRGRIYDFREVRQRRFVQANDSWGRIVPMDVVAREVGVKRAALGQGSLW